MTALLSAIECEKLKGDSQPVEFAVDSLLAIHVALGVWKVKPRRANSGIARRLYEAYEQLRRSRPPGHVTVKHVRAHTGRRGNETVDGLAKRAADDENFEGSDRRVLRAAFMMYAGVRCPLVGQNLGVG